MLKHIDCSFNFHKHFCRCGPATDKVGSGFNALSKYTGLIAGLNVILTAPHYPKRILKVAAGRNCYLETHQHFLGSFLIFNVF